MSMQKKTLAILVALSVGASFGAAAGQKYEYDREYNNPPKPYNYWKKGGGVSESGPGHLVTGGTLDISQDVTIYLTTESHNNYVEANPSYQDYEVDADADGDNEINSNAEEGNGYSQNPSYAANKWDKKRYYSRERRSHDDDLNKIVSNPNGGTATGGDINYSMVMEGNTATYNGTYNGIFSGNSVVSGVGNSITSSVVVNARTSSF